MTSSSIQYLDKLGLTPDEAEIYRLLLGEGSLTAQQIADRLRILPNAVYRLTKRLVRLGFLVKLGQRPLRWQAIPPPLALDGFIATKHAEMEKLKLRAVAQLADQHGHSPTTIDIISGQPAFFEAFIKLCGQAEREVLVISIGEPVPDKLKVAVARALERQIELKFLFHRFTKDNATLLASWVNMGVQVRHYEDWGYHLAIFDGQTSILVANNPEQTTERVGMVIGSQRLSHALRDFFYVLWAQGSEIRVS